MDNLGLYIHLPWCVRKCPYCDFNSHPLQSDLPENDYLDAILRDLAFEANRVTGRAVTSVFFGGGTPSLFSARSIETILSAIARHYRLPDTVEITLEANPGTAEAANFSGYRAAGVNRLSLGVQSLDDDMLKNLGRIHNTNEALDAFDMARTAGFDNINLDLMFGLPRQTKAMALRDLDLAMELAPEHLSWYQLTLEPNTAFAQHPPTLPEHDDCADIQDSGINLLQNQGYSRYEVSAYCQPGRECRHNLNYWRFGDYLGIGAGAHGKLPMPEPTRFARHRHPKTYMNAAGKTLVYQEVKLVTNGALLFEFLLNHLRLTCGFDMSELESSVGVTPEQLQQAVGPALSQGLLEIQDGVCRCTPHGFRFLDEILLLALPGESS